MSAKKRILPASLPSGVREELFNRAGIDPNELARLLKLSIATQEAGLTATRTKDVWYHGVKVEQAQEPDWAQRLKAASDLHDITNAKGSKSANVPQKVVHRVIVNIPSFAVIRKPAITAKATEVPAQETPALIQDKRRSKHLGTHGTSSEDTE